MRHLLASTCALAALLMTSQAHAGEGSAAALSYTWTGLYAGVNGGYGWSTSDWDFAGGGSTSVDDGQGIVGLQVGYDGQIGENLYAGIEASLEATNLDGKTGCGASSCETKISSIGDISARLGLVNNRTLFYVKGGLAYEDTTHHIKTAGVDNSDNGGAEFGYLVGVGAEYALLYNVTTKLEYNYMDFGSRDSRISPSGQNISAKEPINVVKIGFNFKFN